MQGPAGDVEVALADKETSLRVSLVEPEKVKGRTKVRELVAVLVKDGEIETRDDFIFSAPMFPL